MRDGKEISDDYVMLRKQLSSIKEEWRMNDTSWRRKYNISGNKKLTYPQFSLMLIIVIVGLSVMLLLLPNIQSYMMGPELKNDHVYSCPNGDWSGNTTDMKQIGDGYGGVYLYCPMDGKLIGHMSKGMIPGENA